MHVNPVWAGVCGNQTGQALKARENQRGVIIPSPVRDRVGFQSVRATDKNSVTTGKGDGVTIGWGNGVTAQVGLWQALDLPFPRHPGLLRQVGQLCFLL
jgi:hypothetical protein